MPEIINPQSEYNKEMAKFEQFPSKITVMADAKPGNPWKFRPYPRMLYKARQAPSTGKWCLAIERPGYFGFRDSNEWDRACQQADQFAASCLMEVKSEEEHKRAREEGWRDTAQEAMEFREALEKAVSDAAAHRNYQDRLMSAKALAESAAGEAEHFGHLPEIPEQPLKRRRGRPPKAKPEQPQQA